MILCIPPLSGKIIQFLQISYYNKRFIDKKLSFIDENSTYQHCFMAETGSAKCDGNFGCLLRYQNFKLNNCTIGYDSLHLIQT